MRKAYLSVFLLVLIFCVLLAETASADYGYTSVSGIPMAVGFSFRVDFDSKGAPHIVTDYPFETTGATEMNVAYHNAENFEVLTLNYRPATGITKIGSWDGGIFSSPPAEEAYQMMRDGDLIPDDHVYVNTSRFSSETDWVLDYSVSAENYTAYTERTHAQAFNAMGSEGVERTVYYQAGQIDSSRMVKRIQDADLIVEYSASGEITYANITRYGAKRGSYDYDSATGLFGGMPITDLGFEEADLKTEALAATGTRTASLVASEPRGAADSSGAQSSAVFFGSLLTGILIGLVLIKKFIRRRNKEKEPALQETAGVLPPEIGMKSGTEPPAEEFPEKLSASGRG